MAGEFWPAKEFSFSDNRILNKILVADFSDSDAGKYFNHQARIEIVLNKTVNEEDVKVLGNFLESKDYGKDRYYNFPKDRIGKSERSAIFSFNKGADFKKAALDLIADLVQGRFIKLLEAGEAIKVLGLQTRDVSREDGEPIIRR